MNRRRLRERLANQLDRLARMLPRRAARLGCSSVRSDGLSIFTRTQMRSAYGQTIVYSIHESVGHLGTFVSAGVAKKEYDEFFRLKPLPVKSQKPTPTCASWASRSVKYAARAGMPATLFCRPDHRRLHNP
jgi:hypothetical protein